MVFVGTAADGASMRFRIMIVGVDVALRARLARLFSAAGCSVDLAESCAHAATLSLKALDLAIVAPSGLGAGTADLIEELGAVTGREVLIVASESPVAPARGTLDPPDEAALLARAFRMLAPRETDRPARPALRFAGFTFDADARSLTDQQGRQVALTQAEFRLLGEFLGRTGRVLSREFLLRIMSGRESDTHDRSLSMLVLRLRRKIEADPAKPALIAAIPGSGYKFTAAVESVGPMGPQPADGTEAPPSQDERRQITALSVALAAGSAAGFPDDPEELRSLLEAHRRRVAEVVARYGGAAASDVAGEVTAYFGHPAAQEEAAERAVRAALALTGDDPTSAPPRGFQVCAGVATGLVVSGADGEVIGPPVRNAALMRGMAKPGGVVVAAATREIVAGLFAFAPIGGDSAGGAWQVTGPLPAASHSEALYAASPPPIVGREEEQEILLRAWDRARRDEGRVVLLGGEPGIGKSRLLVDLERRAASGDHAALRYFCSPLYRDSALHPVAARWERECGFAPGDSAAQRLAKLEAFAAPLDPAPGDLALVAAMLGLPPSERHPLPEAPPGRRREMTFAALHRALAARARQGPVLMLFEDAHWADDTSLDLMDTLIGRIAELPVLLVVSHRPDFTPPWIGRPRVSVLALARLAPAQSAGLVRSLAGGTALPRAAAECIVARTDGVPLFIEEMTKAVLDDLRRGRAPTPAVPATLQASLMARFDRLPAAKLVAQAAAAVGRDFPHALLVAASGLSEARVARGLEQLADAGLVFRRGMPPDAVYTFKHALVQETAYGSLTTARRREIHRAIAAAIPERMPDWTDAQPEILAHHFTEGGLHDAAVGWWVKAGELAMRKSAYSEAIRHFQKAIQLAEAFLGGPEWRSLRLRLQISYGNVLRVVRGFGMPETLAAFAVARDIAATVDDVTERFPAYYGLWSGSFLHGDLGRMQEIVNAFLRDTERMPGAPEAAVAHRLYGMTRWFEGEFPGTVEHLERALAAYDPARDRPLADRFGQDLACPPLAYLALALWPLGFSERALGFKERMVAHAASTGHVPTIAYAHAHAAVFEIMRCDRERLRPHAEGLAILAEKHSMPLWTAFGVFLDGWLRAGGAEAAAGAARMSDGIAMMRQQQVGLFLPIFIAAQATAEAAAGSPAAALSMVDTLISCVESTGQRWFLGEIYRARGEILLRCRPTDSAQAEAVLLRAIEVARKQGARTFELLAAADLARLREGNGRCAVTPLIRPEH